MERERLLNELRKAILEGNKRQEHNLRKLLLENHMDVNTLIEYLIEFNKEADESLKKLLLKKKLYV